MDFAILTDSTCDLNSDLRENYDIDYVPMHFAIDGQDYIADLDYKTLAPHDFYEVMRQGKRVFTAQVSAVDFKQKFTEYALKGVDVLYISCSGALSASINSARIVASEVMNNYPERKIVCVDSLVSGAGQGILCIIASKLRKKGLSVEDVAQFIEQNKLKANQEGTVEKLSYLRQAGRISGARAFFGGLLNVKPIIISDVNGKNVSIEKVKGRKTSLDKIVERTVVEFVKNDNYDDIFVMHADCAQDAETVKEKLIAEIGIEGEKIHIGYIGPIVGASVGPGTVAVYFLGKQVEYCAE